MTGHAHAAHAAFHARRAADAAPGSDAAAAAARAAVRAYGHAAADNPDAAYWASERAAVHAGRATAIAAIHAHTGHAS